MGRRQSLAVVKYWKRAWRARIEKEEKWMEWLTEKPECFQLSQLEYVKEPPQGS